MFPHGTQKSNNLWTWRHDSFQERLSVLAVCILATRDKSHILDFKWQISGFVDAVKKKKRFIKRHRFVFALAAISKTENNQGSNQLANSLNVLSIQKGKCSRQSQTSACAISRGFYTALWGEPSWEEFWRGCRWMCVEELQSEPVAAEHVVSKRWKSYTSLACCTGTSVKAGEARVCFHFQMCSAWVFSAVGWESSF